VMPIVDAHGTPRITSSLVEHLKNLDTRTRLQMAVLDLSILVVLVLSGSHLWRQALPLDALSCWP